MKNDVQDLYRIELNKFLKCGEEKIFLYWKGRVALYAILKAMGIGPGDEVLIQGYTCVVVANAVLYLGATPVYADIDLSTYNFDMDSLCSKITDKTKVIICQNTYGLSSNLEEIEKIGKEKGIYTIEDCTHGFGGYYRGKPNGISCDASFFSSQWSKPFTTGVGGFSVIHNDSVREKALLLNPIKAKPGFMETFELWLMYFVRTYIINDVTYWPMIRLYRFLSAHNIVVGSSSGEETHGVTMPKDFFKDFSNIQARKGIKSVKKLDEVNRLRKQNAHKYTAFLCANGKNHVDKALEPDHIFLRYPLLVNNREEFRRRAEKARVTLGEWFEQPVYPAYDDLSVWKVKPEEIPNSMYICEHMVNLPTDEKNIDKVLIFLNDNMNYII